MVVVENRPELQIQQSCLFELLLKLFLLSLQGDLSDQVQEIMLLLSLYPIRDENLQKLVHIILIQRKALLINHQQFPQRQLQFLSSIQKHTILQLNIIRHRVQLIACFKNNLNDVIKSHQLLVYVRVIGYLIFVMV